MPGEKTGETKEADYKLFSFEHRRLNVHAKTYQLEIKQLTERGLSLANYHIQKSAAIWVWAMREGVYNNRKRLIKPSELVDAFYDLNYHLQNLWVRIHAYRDKLCRFINFALDLNYPEKDTRLWDLVLKNNIVKRAHIESELRKFNHPPLKQIIHKRKLLSHNTYYLDESFIKLLPAREEYPVNIGARKAISSWRKKVLPEVKQANQAIDLILKLNQRLVNKLFAFYERNGK